MSEYETLAARTARDGRLLEITLRRPPVNVINLEMIEELAGVLLDPGAADVVLFRGAGKHFSAGVDVADHAPERVGEMIRGFHGVFRRLDELEAVTVAAVRGAALGGGLELALACDLTVAATDSRLALPEIRLGVFPPLAAARFPLRYPDPAITELILTGEEMTGERAHALGLISRLAPPDDLDRETERLLDQLLAHSGAALRHARRALMIGRRGGGEALDEVERLYLDELMSTRDAEEGLKAFMQKRAPEWSHS